MTLVFTIDENGVVIYRVSKDKKTELMKVENTHEFSENFWEKFPAAFKNVELKKIKKMIVQYEAGRMGYSKLRSILSVVNTFAVTEGIDVFHAKSDDDVKQIIDKDQKGEKILIPEYDT